MGKRAVSLICGALLGFGTLTLAQQTELHIGLPGKYWFLGVTRAGFRVDARQSRADGSGAMLQATDPSSGVNISVYLEKEPNIRSKEACKEKYWTLARKSPLPKGAVHEVTTESMIAVYWLVKEYEGQPVQQQNVNAYLYKDGVCADVHISKVGYSSADADEFSAILREVRYWEE